MAKEIKYDMDARDLLKKGVDELAGLYHGGGIMIE